jgi:transposase
MEAYRTSGQESKTVFVGVDLHRLSWHVTVRTEDQELFSGTLPGHWEALRSLLDRYQADPIQLVYEAGYFGFWLHDRLVGYGVDCIVTPPSLKERYHRQVIRRRRQLIGDRVRTQNRIKAELRFYGIEIGERRGPWPRWYVEKLWSICFNDPWMQESFGRLLEQYEFLSEQISKQTQLVRKFSETPLYRGRVAILRSVPGIGLIAAMELLVELQDVARFRRAEQLAAYVGLIPSQYSSAEKIRMGRITGIGKSGLRGTLVEASWKLITKDGAMAEKYESIKARSGAKRAIVAIARTLLLRTRRMLLDGNPYAVGLLA